MTTTITADYVLSQLGQTPDAVADDLHRFSETAKLLSSSRPRLLDEHPQQWVGLYNGTVEVFGDSLDSVICQLDSRQIPKDEMIIRYINTEVWGQHGRPIHRS